MKSPPSCRPVRLGVTSLSFLDYKPDVGDVEALRLSFWAPLQKLNKDPSRSRSPSAETLKRCVTVFLGDRSLETHTVCFWRSNRYLNILAPGSGVQPADAVA